MIFVYGLMIVVGGISLILSDEEITFFAGCALIFVGAGVILAASYMGGRIFGPLDPINEARIYAVFGQKAQAIEILEHAFRANPQRTEIANKLAEMRGR